MLSLYTLTEGLLYKVCRTTPVCSYNQHISTYLQQALEQDMAFHHEDGGSHKQLGHPSLITNAKVVVEYSFIARSFLR
ncbi:Os02g0787966 [Oryza sativa Japonica Group]|uniref:Os02g0787966 protein n=1 Tax=Oryza sativa subsp. japonica TaxID=39947 RepID=A0A0P0VQG8_ORYSJ|nr:hypothetical protein EE612_014139 [Oryza sativa]BAS81291.1 Os02g0787966 [Oryza sativa Japonica Group]